MTDSNLNDSLKTWVTFGFLILAMIAFAGQFIDNNSPGALGDTEEIFNRVAENITGNLIELDVEGNQQLNISSLVSSENSQQGLFVSTSNSYGFWGSIANIFKSTFRLIYFVLPQPFSGIVVAIFSGLLSFAVLFYIIKLGRSFF